MIFIILGLCLGVLELGGAAPEMVISGETSSRHILFEVEAGANPRLAFVPNGFFGTGQVFSLRNDHRCFALVMETFLSSIFLSILDLAKLDEDVPMEL